MRAEMTRALVAISLTAMVGGAVLVLPVASASADSGGSSWTLRPSSAANGWSIVKEFEPGIISSATATFVTGPSGAQGLGSLALATGPGTPGTPNRSGKIYLTQTFAGTGIDPTRLTALNYRTQSGALAPYLSVELYDASAVAGQRYQNLGVDSRQRRRHAGHHPGDLAGLGHQQRRLGRALHRRRADRRHVVPAHRR